MPGRAFRDCEKGRAPRGDLSAIVTVLCRLSMFLQQENGKYPFNSQECAQHFLGPPHRHTPACIKGTTEGERLATGRARRRPGARRTVSSRPPRRFQKSGIKPHGQRRATRTNRHQANGENHNEAHKANGESRNGPLQGQRREPPQRGGHAGGPGGRPPGPALRTISKVARRATKQHEPSRGRGGI